MKTGASGPQAVVLDLIGETPRATLNLPAGASDLVNVAFTNKGKRLLMLDAQTGLLISIAVITAGLPTLGRQSRQNIAALGVVDPQGLAVGPAGSLFILDAAGPRIVSLEPGAGNTFGSPTVIDLAMLAGTPLRGLAINPVDGHLHLLNPVRHELHEITQNGAPIATRDLSALGVINPRGLTFAPSADSTDGQARNLYIVGSAPGVIVYHLAARQGVGARGHGRSGGASELPVLAGEDGP